MTPTLKPPNRPDPDLNKALGDYLAQFSYRVDVKLGHTYTQEFKDFTAWCEARLGPKYKAWFLYTLGNGRYTLWLREDKWASFLALTWVDVIE